MKLVRHGLAFAILVCLAGCASPRHTQMPATFRVMTYNIHHGEGLDGKVDLLRLAELIKRERADLVALQEVDKGVARTARRDFPAELAELTGLSCVFSNNYDHQGGEYGNAVLTRFPVMRWTNTHYQKVNEPEQRGILQLTLDVRGRKVVFMVTHLDHRPDDAARWSNVGEIEALVKKYAGHAILVGGDFNDSPGSRVCRRLNETFDDTWALVGQGEGFTVPAAEPRRRIDYLWTSKDKSLVPLKAWVPQSDASDHRPVVAEFEIR